MFLKLDLKIHMYVSGFFIFIFNTTGLYLLARNQLSQEKLFQKIKTFYRTTSSLHQRSYPSFCTARQLSKTVLWWKYLQPNICKVFFFKLTNFDLWLMTSYYYYVECPYPMNLWIQIQHHSKKWRHTWYYILY